jgi:dienelactone hydrolase
VNARTLISIVLAALLSLCGCKRGSAGEGARLTDYAKARAAFKTTLSHRAPSPQSFEPITIPEGVEQLEYRSGPLLLNALFASATSQGKQPAVLFLHGGFAFGIDDWDMAQPFREAGFAVMMPILRGENGQPGAFSMFYDEVDDVVAAASTLAAQPSVDPTRIFLVGHSAGETLTLLAAQASTQFRAGASLSGSPDQRRFLDSGWDRAAPFDAANEDEVRMRSPLVFAESFKCPVRILYGSEEKFFAAASRETARLARARGLDVESAAVPGGHFTAIPEEVALAIAFFRAQR